MMLLLSKRARLAALVGLALAGLWGCGDDDDGGPGTDAGMTDGGGGGDTDSGGGGGNTIADIAAGNDNFDVLVAAATRAGLVETLSGTTQFTVFAPTDAAFVEFLDVADEAAALTAIESVPVMTLTGILTYHAVPGSVRSTALTAGPVSTVSTFSIIVGTEPGVTINGGNAVAGGANVVMADIEASNGVIHVIDRVLVPPTVADLARYAGLTTLAGAVTSQGLAETLSGAGPFTVFAPTNAAFSALGTLPTGEALTNVLLYHVVGARVPSTAVPAGSASAPGVAPSLSENEYEDNLSLLFRVEGSTVRINGGNTVEGGANVIIADVFATNGVVHVVDRVLLPMDVVGAATAAGLTGLTGAATAAADLPDGTSVVEALQAQAPYTVFAPTNAAFAAVTPTPPPATLRDVLLYHVLDPAVFTSPVLSGELPAAATALATLNDADIPFVPGPPPTFDGAGLVQADIVVTNGVIHVIDAVMLP